jgi:hypothetical protein
MAVREIQGHLRELYCIDLSPDLIRVVATLSWSRWPDG